VIIGAEERVNALRAVPHVLVRLSGRIVHLVMLTWSYPDLNVLPGDLTVRKTRFSPKFLLLRV
jgi:hypothetical protein